MEKELRVNMVDLALLVTFEMNKPFSSSRAFTGLQIIILQDSPT